MKVFLNNHEKIEVIQKNSESGCVPAGYEWMIRFAKIYNADIINDAEFDSFQDDLDLLRRGLGANSFIPISDAIQKKYSQIKIEIKSFDDGQEKIEFIKNLIEKQNPCLISIPVFRGADFRGYYIMPITGFDDDMKIFYSYNPIDEINYDKILKLHNEYIGGHDISWMSLNET